VPVGLVCIQVLEVFERVKRVALEDPHCHVELLHSLSTVHDELADFQKNLLVFLAKAHSCCHSHHASLEVNLILLLLFLND